MAATLAARDEARGMLRRLFRVAESLRDMDSDMPVVQMSVLFHVAMNEGVTQREICAALSLPTSTTSRSVASLSEVHRLGKPGLGLISWYDDPEDRRTKRLVLTPKGRTFIERISKGD